MAHGRALASAAATTPNYRAFHAWLLQRGVESLTGARPIDPVARAGMAVFVIGPHGSPTVSRLLKEFAACDAHWRKRPDNGPADVVPL